LKGPAGPKQSASQRINLGYPDESGLRPLSRLATALWASFKGIPQKGEGSRRFAFLKACHNTSSWA